MDPMVTEEPNLQLLILLTFNIFYICKALKSYKVYKLDKFQNIYLKKIEKY